MEVTEPEIGDAFGRLLLDTLRSGGVDSNLVEVIERDSGYIGTGAASRYFAPPESWQPIERELLRSVHGFALDIGCGAGRHSLALQELGNKVTGLDVSEGTIAVCRERGVGSLFHGSIEDLAASNPQQFDSFLMLGNNLGLLESAKHARAVLATLARLGTEGAVVVGTTIDPYDTDVHEHLAYHERNRALGRMGGQVQMRVRHRGLASDWMDYLMFSESELPQLIDGSGWVLSKTLRDGARVGIVLKRA
jgi:SAM-dependent methyltransferase